MGGCGPSRPTTTRRRISLKYDDASWHYDADFPSDLEPVAAATHIGMLVAWAVHSGLGGETFSSEFPALATALLERRVTPGKLLMQELDEKFCEDELSPEGQEFVAGYYDYGEGKYLMDYEQVFAADLPSLYHVEDSWSNFDLLKPVLDRRLQEWRKSRD